MCSSKTLQKSFRECLWAGYYPLLKVVYFLICLFDFFLWKPRWRTWLYSILYLHRPNLEFSFTTVVLGKQKFLHFDHFFRFANTSVFLSSQFSPCVSSSVTLFFYASHKALVGHYAHVNKLLTSIRPLKMAE